VRLLRSMDWIVLRVWEHQLTKDGSVVIAQTLNTLLE
jgi:hypothetical protein